MPSLTADDRSPYESDYPIRRIDPWSDAPRVSPGQCWGFYIEDCKVFLDEGLGLERDYLFGFFWLADAVVKAEAAAREYFLLGRRSESESVTGTDRESDSVTVAVRLRTKNGGDPGHLGALYPRYDL